MLGTLLGAGVTHVFQRGAIARTEDFTRREKLRQERVDAYSAYAGALVNYRRVLLDRWFSRHENRPEDGVESRFRSYELRSAAQEALFRVELLTEDDELAGLARRALDAVTDLHKARDRDELTERRVVSLGAVDAFVSAAKRHV